MTRVPDVKTPLSLGEAIAAIATAYDRLLAHTIDASTLAILTTHAALETGRRTLPGADEVLGLSMHCWNWGNVKGAHPETGAYCMFPCDELLAPDVARENLRTAPPVEDAYAKAAGACGSASARLKGVAKDGRWIVQFYPPHPQCRFRAFEDAADGAYAQLRFLAIDTTPNDGRPNRYAEAWRAADEHDDPAEFSHALRKAGYYTAPEDQYTRGVVSIYKGYLPKCAAYLEARAAFTKRTISETPESVPVAPTFNPDRVRAHVLGAVALTLDQSTRDYFARDRGLHAA